MGRLGVSMGFSSFAGMMRRGLAVGVLGSLLSAGGVNSAENTQYTYDALGRVVSAIDQTGKTVAYTYDSAGNRTRVSNGAEFTEITPTAFTASTNGGTTGLTVVGAMKDGGFTALASVHATQIQAGAWVQADLGSVKKVNNIKVAPAVAATVGAGIEDLNGVLVEYSTDGANWTTSSTINGAVAGVSQSIAVGGVSLRYLRLRRVASGQVSVGDFRFYSAAALGSPLIANPDYIANNGAASVTFNPRTNDSSFNNVAFTISAAEKPPHGQAIVNAGASITYIPDVGYVGGDTFSYTIADGSNSVASAQVFANVTAKAAANTVPVAINDNFTVGDRLNSAAVGQTYLQPLANDYDQDRDLLSMNTVTAPAHGTATLSGTSQVIYQPTAGYSGVDSFTYTAKDSRGGISAAATVTLTVANTPPAPADDSASITQNTNASLSPLDNDLDANGDTLTISEVTVPAHGAASLIQGTSPIQVKYSPQAGYIGPDAFKYTVQDGRGGSTSASISVNVTPPLQATLLVMEPNLYGGSASISGSVFTVPTSGMANVYHDKAMSTGKYYWEVRLLCAELFTGVANIVGTAKSYGGWGGGNAGIRAVYKQTWVGSANSEDAGATFGYGVANDVFGFALDVDAKTLKILRNNIAGPTLALTFPGPYFAHSGAMPGSRITGQPCTDTAAKGEFLIGSGSTVYSPPTGYSHISTPVANTAPTAANDMATIPNNSWVSLDPRLNDSDANGDILTISVVGAPAHGTATNAGSFIRYIPTAGYVGSDSFTYTVSDGRGGAASATTFVSVTAATTRSFSISPAVAGKTIWNLATDGPLDLSAAGTWTIVPAASFAVSAKAWGAAGGGAASGGGGGFAGGSVALYAGAKYTISVGGPGNSSTGVGGANGGGAGGRGSLNGSPAYGKGGGGYSVISSQDGFPILIAGGGGGQGGYYSGGAGGAGGGFAGLQGLATADASGGVGGASASAPPTYNGAEGDWDYYVTQPGGGGGGGGYNGGRGGGSGLYSGGGGGGGSGFADGAGVYLPSLVAGNGNLAGNSSDADRGAAAQLEKPGKIRIW